MVVGKLGVFYCGFVFVQLLQQVSLQNVFHGFMEGLIRFKPTYKFDPGTDNLDSR